MAEFRDFFAASVGSAAALIGLLFVAITIAPERIFSDAADAQKRAKASLAFIGLANVFFVSLAGLLPVDGAEVMLFVALIASYRVIRESMAMARLFPERRRWRPVGLISLCVYAFEFSVAVRMVTGHRSSAQDFAFIIFGLYGYALWNSWALLDAGHE